ncbi:hypothetical protein MTR_2g102675 [Medicago truncatula]|uniref:Uncharacterized protein n=1 Tax=Medicago truncatula TaxID=3880 RepID=A0A072VDR3_MEDTR|nr:hypothetical protein MTR_2g102675 [Medicago truncatula]
MSSSHSKAAYLIYFAGFRRQIIYRCLLNSVSQDDQSYLSSAEIALELFSEMLVKKIRRGREAYNRLIYGFCITGQFYGSYS